MTEKKKPEQNWVSISVVLIVLAYFVILLYKDILFQGGFLGGFYFLLILIALILTFVFVLSNIMLEYPDFELRKSIANIRKIEVYESWYFLTALGLIFGLVVWHIFVNVHNLLGVAICGILYTFLFGWVRDILKHRRERKIS